MRKRCQGLVLPPRSWWLVGFALLVASEIESRAGAERVERSLAASPQIERLSATTEAWRSEMQSTTTGPILGIPGWPYGVNRIPETSVTAGILFSRAGRGVGFPEIGARAILLDGGGVDLLGWPKDLQAAAFASACFVDLDGDGQREVFFAGQRVNYFGFTADGTLLPGWPVVATTNPASGVTAPCSIGDLDGDGTLELVGATSLGEVSVWNQNGTLLPGWPRVLPFIPRPRVAVIPAVAGSPALADLDEDGFLEVILTSQNGNLYVFRHDGTDLPGFPYDLNAGQAGVNDPAVADIDHDGHLEIIVATVGQPPNRDVFKQFHIVRRDGTPFPGYPLPLTANVHDGVAIADLDGDGELWVVMALHSPTETIVVYSARTGQMRDGFPVTHDLGQGATAMPLVGDITGDGWPDIVWAQSFEGLFRAMVFGWDRFGNRIQQFPLVELLGDLVSSSSPTLLDLNNDGRIDMMPADSSFNFPVPVPTIGRLSAFDLGQPFDARTLEWPMDGHDVRHTGVYRQPVDELELRGVPAPSFMPLDRAQGAVTLRLYHQDRRGDLAALLSREGVRITEVNDRSIPPIEGRLLTQPGPADGKAVSLSRPDLIVQFEGSQIAAAILDRLRRAGVEPGAEQSVRLKVESRAFQRRRVGGEFRVTVQMPAGG